MTIWRGDRPLILASQSRTRRMLLANAGLEVDCIPADIDERGIQRDANLAQPAAVAALLAREKALAVSRAHAGRYVIGADQTLALGPRLFNKPAGRDQARDQIRALADGVHQLHSAVAVARDGAVLFAHVAVANMSVRPLDDAAIEAYLDAAGPAVTTSVGAYQLEGVGVHLFERIDGDHFTILGLPLLPLFDFLRGQRLLAIQ